MIYCFLWTITVLCVCSLGNHPVWHIKQACFNSIIYVIRTKFLKKAGQFCGFPLFSTYSIGNVLPLCFPEFTVLPRFPTRQPSALKSLWPSFLAHSSDLLFANGPLTCTPNPVTIQSHWLRASWMSGSFLSCFCFQNVLCRCLHNAHSSHSFSCCCITSIKVGFCTPVTSTIWQWLVLGSWLLSW